MRGGDLVVSEVFLCPEGFSGNANKGTLKNSGCAFWHALLWHYWAYLSAICQFKKRLYFDLWPALDLIGDKLKKERMPLMNSGRELSNAGSSVYYDHWSRECQKGRKGNSHLKFMLAWQKKNTISIIERSSWLESQCLCQSPHTGLIACLISAEVKKRG